MTLPIMDNIPSINSINELNIVLKQRGCHRCSLGFQSGLNGVCVSRGSRGSKKVILGEAPGRHEDSRSEPFTGPAGQLLNKIWASVGMDTNDWYVTNTVLCRPIAQPGSGKENYTPRMEQQKQCRPYLDLHLSLLKPEIVVTLGRVATESMLGRVPSMGSVRGFVQERDGIKIFPMLHPAALLRGKGTERNKQYRQQTWEDIQYLKAILEENNGQSSEKD